jgi:hypothetical protein
VTNDARFLSLLCSLVSSLTILSNSPTHGLSKTMKQTNQKGLVPLWHVIFLLVSALTANGILYAVKTFPRPLPQLVISHSPLPSATTEPLATATPAPASTIIQGTERKEKANNYGSCYVKNSDLSGGDGGVATAPSEEAFWIQRSGVQGWRQVTVPLIGYKVGGGV